jgi:nitrogen-specific signal transduction histidine kinase
MKFTKLQLDVIRNALCIAANETQREAISLYEDAPETSRALIDESEAYAALLELIDNGEG